MSTQELTVKEVESLPKPCGKRTTTSLDSLREEMNKKNYDYGKCHVCGEQMREQRINQEFWLKGKLLVIESVPAGVCPQCGEKIVKADVGRQLAMLIGNLRRVPKQRTISVPVIRYVTEVA